MQSLVHSERLQHRLQERAVWKKLLQCTLDDYDDDYDDDDDDNNNNNNTLELSASLCFVCALYSVDVLDPCMFNSSHFLSLISKTPTIGCH